MEMSPEVGELFAALAGAQANITDAVKNGQNNRNSYATLESVLASVRLAFAPAGLAVVQAAQDTDTGVVVETLIAHKSGQWVRSSLAVPVRADKGMSTVQSMGSAITYLRRYSLMALAGIAPEDDDGVGAGQVLAERKSGKTPDALLAEACARAKVSIDAVVAYAVAQGMDPPSKDPRGCASWLDGGGSASVRAWAAEEDAEPEPTKWSGKERSTFFAEVDTELKRVGIEYEQLAEWCELNKRPRPSLMPAEQRKKLVTAINGDAELAMTVAEWVATSTEEAA